MVSARRIRAALLAAVAGIAPACAQDGGAAAARPAADAGAPGVEAADFTGEIVPTNATEIFPPLILFSRSGWGGWVWSPDVLKLVELKEDGAEVKAGEPIARFDPRWLAEEIKEAGEERQRKAAEAESGEATLRSEQTRLEADLRQKKILADRAALDLGRKTAVSAQQYALYVIDEKIARFEAEAAERRLAAHLAYARGEREYYRSSIDAARGDEAYLKTTVDRFTVRAPHDGVVRHLLHSGLRRKVQNGDEIPLAKPFIAIAKDKNLSVRFFVPESAVGLLAPGAEVDAIDPVSSRPFRARVRSIQPFPQEIGQVKNDLELPNARETVHVAFGDLTPVPEDLSSGSEVQVRRR